MLWCNVGFSQDKSKVCTYPEVLNKVPPGVPVRPGNSTLVFVSSMLVSIFVPIANWYNKFFYVNTN